MLNKLRWNCRGESGSLNTDTLAGSMILSLMLFKSVLNEPLLIKFRLNGCSHARRLVAH